MPHTPTPTEVLTTVVGTLVAKQHYASMEEALRSLALSAVRSKTLHYRRRIRRLEKNTTWTSITSQITCTGARHPPRRTTGWRGDQPGGC